MQKIRVNMVGHASSPLKKPDCTRVLRGPASRVALAAMLASCSLGIGCRSASVPREVLLQQLASESAVLEQALARQDEPAPGTLRFALAFGAGADLDLFVTGPRYESVYFANTPSAIGGALESDVRCDAPAPRIETITFPDPPPGPYRVSIDFPERCDGLDTAVPFAVTVRRRDNPAHAKTHGIIRPGEFLTIVLETDIR